MKQEYNLVTNKLDQARTLRDEYQSKGALLDSDFFCANETFVPASSPISPPSDTPLQFSLKICHLVLPLPYVCP
jgi:hypothetical protein